MIEARYILRRIFRPGYVRYMEQQVALETIALQETRHTMDTREWLGGELNRLREAVEAIHPVHVDMDETVANAMLDKMRGPLTVSQTTSDWLRTLAPHVPMSWTFPLGWDANAGQMRATITPEGTLNLELISLVGEILWRGEFTPPDYRKETTNE